jgi:hypothetical protein
MSGEGHVWFPAGGSSSWAKAWLIRVVIFFYEFWTFPNFILPHTDSLITSELTFISKTWLLLFCQCQKHISATLILSPSSFLLESEFSWVLHFNCHASCQSGSSSKSTCLASVRPWVQTPVLTKKKKVLFFAPETVKTCISWFVVLYQGSQLKKSLSQKAEDKWTIAAEIWWQCAIVTYIK